jgi:hypothetical protein
MRNYKQSSLFTPNENKPLEPHKLPRNSQYTSGNDFRTEIIIVVVQPRPNFFSWTTGASHVFLVSQSVLNLHLDYTCHSAPASPHPTTCSIMHWSGASQSGSEYNIILPWLVDETDIEWSILESSYKLGWCAELPPVLNGKDGRTAVVCLEAIVFVAIDPLDHPNCWSRHQRTVVADMNGV